MRDAYKGRRYAYKREAGRFGRRRCGSVTREGSIIRVLEYDLASSDSDNAGRFGAEYDDTCYLDRRASKCTRAVVIGKTQVG